MIFFPSADWKKVYKTGDPIMVNRAFISLLVILFLFFSFLSMPVMTLAGDDESIDEIMDDFEDKESPLQDDDTDDVLDGFDEDDGVIGETEDEHGASFLTLDGYFKLSSSYNFAHGKPDRGETDWRGLSRLRSELQLDLTANLTGSWKAFISGKGYYDFAYNIRGRNGYTDEVLDSYENEMELRDAYIQGSITDSLDIKAGRQVVVWGKSDNIRVTDVLNPLDIREPGLTDIEDLRLPVAMTRLDYYLGPWNITGIALHEIRFNKTPEFGSDFYPAPIPPPHEEIPSDHWDNTEFAASLRGVFSGWDVSLYWADIYDDAFHLEFVSGGVSLVGFPPRVVTNVISELKHSRLKMFGADFNIAYGNWLFKTEAAYFQGLRFFTDPVLSGFTLVRSPGRKYYRTDVMVGLEYAGFKNTAISVEAVNRHINNYDDVLKRTPNEVWQDQFQIAGRVTRDFFNETLSLTALASIYGGAGQIASFERFSAEYDYSDTVTITGGIVLYQSGDLAGYRHIADNDRLFLEIKYGF